MSTIKFSQGANSILVNFEFGKKSSEKQIVGTACNELFELVDLQAQNVIKLFKFSQPVDITIESEKFTVSTESLNVVLRTKLKLNKTSDSKRRFAKRVFALTNYALRERKELTNEQANELFA